MSRTEEILNRIADIEIEIARLVSEQAELERELEDEDGTDQNQQAGD